MERKGILNEQQESFLCDVIFHKVKFPSWMPKWFTKPVLLRAIRMIDNLVLNRIKPQIKAVLIPFIDAAMQGRIEEMRRLATDLAVANIDFKNISKETELAMVDSWTRVIVSHAFGFIEYRNGKGEIEA